MSYVKKIHFEHPSGGTVCDHKNTDGTMTLFTKDKNEVTCLKCESILSGEFGGKPFKRPWLA